MRKTTERHSVNPFLNDMVIPVGGKNIQISTLGKDNNILVNQTTGEHRGTHVIARKKVDKAKFVKTFADYMAFTFDLTRSGNKALRVVMWAVQEKALGRDVVTLDKYTLEEFLNEMSISAPFSYPTFARGVSELEKASIIAKCKRVGDYYINPQCLFNGDRIAFTTLIELKTKDEEQLDLIDHINETSGDINEP